MNEEQIRQIVKDEMQKNYLSGRPQVPPHRHDGNSNLRIQQESIVPGTRTSGSITFSTKQRYTLNITANPNPTLLLCYGIVVNDVSSPTFRAHTFGTAQLGRSYYFQPSSTNSVTAGGPVQPFIQSSTYLSVDNAGPTFHALTDEENLVDVEYGGSIHARLKLVAFNSSSITLDVPYLDSGWAIIVNIVVI